MRRPGSISLALLFAASPLYAQSPPAGAPHHSHHEHHEHHHHHDTKKDAKAPKTPPPAEAAKPSATPADPGRDAADRIQHFYESTASLHARFDQELDAAMGGKKKASGEVWLKKPGRMRWEYELPEKKLM